MAAKYPGHGDMSLSRAEKMGLNCPVCLEVYNEPKSLACLHTFCETCIHSYVMKMKENGTLKDGIECPLCRKTTLTEIKDSPPEEWTASLPNNYAIQSVLDAVHSGDEDKCENYPRCQPCQKINITMEATKYCSNCQEYQCAECVNNHKRYAGLTVHYLVELDASSSNKTLKMSSDFGKLDKCEAHSKLIEYYCVDHSKLCCSGCAIITHRKCESVVEIQEMTEHIDTTNSNPLKTKLTELRDKVKLTSNHFKKCDKEIAQRISELPDKIETVRDKFNKMVDILKEKVLNEAAVMKKQKSVELNETHTECESLIAALETTLCIYEDVLSHGSPSQNFIARHKIEEQLSMYEQRAEEQFTKLQSLTIIINLHVGEHTEEVLKSGKEAACLTVNSTNESINSILEREPVKLELDSWIDVSHSDKLVKLEKAQTDLQTQLADKETTINQYKAKLQEQENMTERVEKELEILKTKDSGPVLGEKIRQWVSSVRSFSSQCDYKSWRAEHVIGASTVYPKYGDAGVWAPGTWDANQYITVDFEEKVMVTAVDIYETFNAGGVKQISAVIPNTETGNLDVFPLYTCPSGGMQVINKSRIFSPTLQTIDRATNTIRVDVDCSVSRSLVCIAAIQLHGNRFGSSGKT